MEVNTWNVNYSDDYALLPPRKRLLAGLKRQNSDVKSPAASPDPCNPNLSYEEIYESSRIAAIEAKKVAEAARANAEEKAEKAGKAVAAAKIALEFAASLAAANEEKSVKKMKIKKHEPVEEALYSENKRKTSRGTDEEVARNLHRAINSSTRMVKRLKTSGNDVVRDRYIEGPIKKRCINTVDLNKSNSEHDEGDHVRLDKGAGVGKTDQLNLEIFKVEKFSEALDSFGKKLGKFKQKKLPLSICRFEDQSDPKIELRSRDSLMAVERTSVWKHQSVKAQKVGQS